MQYPLFTLSLYLAYLIFSLNLNPTVKSVAKKANGSMVSLNEELNEAAKELKKKQKNELKNLNNLDLKSFQVNFNSVFDLNTMEPYHLFSEYKINLIVMVPLGVHC